MRAKGRLLSPCAHPRGRDALSRCTYQPTGGAAIRKSGRPRAIGLVADFRSTKQARLVLSAAALVVTACGVASPTTSPPSERTVFFPQQNDRPPQLPSALLRGKLVATQECLRVTSEGGTDYLLVWPADVMLSTERNVIEIRNRVGQVVARGGSEIQVGGGEIAAPIAERFSRQLRREPTTCSGPYWLAGEILVP